VKGKVTKKYLNNGEHWVEVDISTENPAGEKTTVGTAAVVLPSRGQVSQYKDKGG
jgi:hypothetical protein